MKIELSDGAVNDIIGESLADTLSYLLESINHRQNGGSLAYYDNDPVKDVEYIQEKVNAVREVLDLYGI